jgi:hypothetical protein
MNIQIEPLVKNSETSSVTVIPEYIFSVGHNSNYIIAKQHPKPERFSSTVNTKITNYYIIDVKNSDEFVQKIYYLTKINLEN